MDLSYLTFASSKDNLIKQKKTLSGEVKTYDITSCCDFLIDYQNAQHNDPANQAELSKVEHWWERKWQVSLDYYLSSPSQKKPPKQNESAPIVQKECVDMSLCDVEVKDSLQPIQALLKRKTFRKFQENNISFHLFSAILKELQEEIFSDVWKYYIVVFNVEKITPGIYRYCSRSHGLHLVKEGLFRNESVSILCGMAASFTASFLIILSIDLEKAMKNFPYERALREIYIASGILAQKILLKGMQNYIGGLPSPAMKDSEMCSFLNIEPSKCIPIYSITMGIIPETTLNTTAFP